MSVCKTMFAYRMWETLKIEIPPPPIQGGKA